MAQGTELSLTGDLYKAIVTIIDERVREIRVTREDFDTLTGAVRQLAEAQARTEARAGRAGGSPGAVPKGAWKASSPR